MALPVARIACTGLPEDREHTFPKQEEATQPLPCWYLKVLKVHTVRTKLTLNGRTVCCCAGLRGRHRRNRHRATAQLHNTRIAHLRLLAFFSGRYVSNQLIS